MSPCTFTKSARAGIIAESISSAMRCRSVGSGTVGQTRSATQLTTRNFAAAHMMLRCRVISDDAGNMIETHELTGACRLERQFRCQLSAVGGQMVCRDRGVCLLLIVNRDVLELFAFRSGSAHRRSAALAVGRDHSLTGGNDFAVFLSGELQCPIIHLRVRARV
jgi:hypothetical protein